MSRVKPLSPYMANRNLPNPQANPLLKYAVNKKDPSELSSPRLESMDE